MKRRPPYRIVGRAVTMVRGRKINDARVVSSLDCSSHVVQIAESSVRLPLSLSVEVENLDEGGHASLLIGQEYAVTTATLWRTVLLIPQLRDEERLSRV